MLPSRWSTSCFGRAGPSPRLRQLCLSHVGSLIETYNDATNLLILASYHEDVNEWDFGKLSALREVALAFEYGYGYYYMGWPIVPASEYK